MINLDAQKVVVIVFAMHECPACDHYLPRFLAEVEALKQHGYPFVVYEPDAVLPPGSIPVIVYDAASENVDIQKLADRYKVEATPTTIVVPRGPGGFKCEGSLANNQIQWVLMMASEAAKS